MTLGSDGGHKGVGFDASFGLNDEALLNYGQQSIKKTHDAAMVLIERAYGTDPAYFYFAGFSQGGHEALDAAGRYSKDYDGVVAGTPTFNVTMMHAGIGSMYRDALYRDGGVGWINPTERALIVSSVYAACDPIDGLADGVISDTEGCLDAFDIQSLRCADGADTGDTCLSDAQIETVDLIAAGKDLGFEIAGNSFAAPGPILTGGTYDRFGLGTEPQPHNPMNGTEAFQYTVLDAVSKYIITRDTTLDTPNWQLDAVDPPHPGGRPDHGHHRRQLPAGVRQEGQGADVHRNGRRRRLALQHDPVLRPASSQTSGRRRWTSSCGSTPCPDSATGSGRSARASTPSRCCGPGSRMASSRVSSRSRTRTPRRRGARARSASTRHGRGSTGATRASASSFTCVS